MPAPYPAEFKRRAVELATQPDAKIAEVARDLGIAESGLRRWIDQAKVDAGERDGLSTAEKRELVELRRRTRVLEMENEILKRAAAYFAKENVLPNEGPADRGRARPVRVPDRNVLPGPGHLDRRVL
jgi:transposase